MSDTKVNTNETVCLTVEFTPHDTLNVNWYHKQEQVIPNRRIHLLTEQGFSMLYISETLPEDQGLYQCEVQSTNQTIKTECTLTISGNFLD